MNITLSESAKVILQDKKRLKDAHELQQRGYRELVKSMRTENDLLLICLLRMETLVLNRRVHFVSCFGIWTCRSKVIRK